MGCQRLRTTGRQQVDKQASALARIRRSRAPTAFGKAIHLSRVAAGWSRQRLAELVGTSRITVYQIETRGQLPGVWLGLAFADALGTTVERLARGVPTAGWQARQRTASLLGEDSPPLGDEDSGTLVLRPRTGTKEFYAGLEQPGLLDCGPDAAGRRTLPIPCTGCTRETLARIRRAVGHCPDGTPDRRETIIRAMKRAGLLGV